MHQSTDLDTQDSSPTDTKENIAEARETLKFEHAFTYKRDLMSDGRVTRLRYYISSGGATIL